MTTLFWPKLKHIQSFSFLKYYVNTTTLLLRQGFLCPVAVVLSGFRCTCQLSHAMFTLQGCMATVLGFKSGTYSIFRLKELHCNDFEYTEYYASFNFGCFKGDLGEFWQCFFDIVVYCVLLLSLTRGPKGR